MTFDICFPFQTVRSECHKRTSLHFKHQHRQTETLKNTDYAETSQTLTDPLQESGLSHIPSWKNNSSGHPELKRPLSLGKLILKTGPATETIALNDLRCFPFDHIWALPFIHHTSRLTERKTAVRGSISTMRDAMKTALDSDCIR